ncbi:MAG: glycosyltransferase family 4 protein [Anaerolineae bacterium]|nr:glycosyltransferase family 4 protein [Anaerolineae bacterium]
MGKSLRVLMITQKVDLDDDVLGFTHTWVNKLAERVAHLHVLALSVGRHELRDNATLYSMGKERGAGRWQRLVNFTRVVAPLVLRRRVDVVFVHMVPLYAILAAPWTKLARVPLVMWYTHKHVGLTLRVAHALVDKVVTASAESFRLPSDKVVVTGHGIETELFKPAEGPRPERPFTVLSVGRISPIKDYETLIAAADILINERGLRHMRFVVVGDAGTPEQVAYRQGLLAEVRRRGLADYFEFVGAVPHREVVRYYQQADLFVSASRTGSLDKAGLEAMACNLPLVTSNEALQPLLGDQKGILTFNPGDASECADRIQTVLDLPASSRYRLGSVLATRAVADYNLDSLMNRLVLAISKAQYR